MLNELLILFLAGFFGGLLNAIAGGGSFITFPALLAVGVPAISANATNTFASCAGYLSGAYALKDELKKHQGSLIPILLLSLVGSALGAWLLLQTSDQTFRSSIPWLLLFATLVFIFGTRFNQYLQNLSNHHHTNILGGILLFIILLLVAAYGGFFNAGLGIVLLSYFTLHGLKNINLMNALKLLLSTSISLIAIILFIFDDIIAWYQGSIVLTGTLVGGYIAAHYSRQLPQHVIRKMVILTSCIITCYFFYDTYYPIHSAKSVHNELLK